MDDVFDVIVIGSGPAGETLAGRCADGGLSVVLVERELVGGECSYWGCIPSKVLLRPGDVVAAARRVPGAKQAVSGHIDVEAALARRDAATSGWDDRGTLEWLDEKQITLVRGAGRLDGPRRVMLDGRLLRARRAVAIATGSSALVPPIRGLADARPWNNRDATAVKDIPRRLLVLGGGAIGLEMAQAFSRLGAEEVTVVEASPRLLPREEPFAGEEIGAAFAREGIDVISGHAMSAVERNGADGPVHATLDNGSVFEADEILVAVGRRPATVELGLETVGLQPGRFITVDDRLRATGIDGEWLYAVGDCNGRALFTHMGKYQARIAADVILGRERAAVADPRIVPRVTFTDPQVCAVGMTETEAHDAGVTVRAVRCSNSAVAATYTQGEDLRGTSQIIVDETRRVVVGATFVGPSLQELLHSATVAIAGEVTLDRLWHAVPSFPTVSEVWLRLLETYGL
jgi:dihydrolipoamide dehydrogenase